MGPGLKLAAAIIVGGAMGMTLEAQEGTGGRPEGVLRVMTYNIHAGIGMDGQLDIDRILEVVGRIAPDLGGLNEVDYGAARSGYTDVTGEIRRKLRLSSIFAQAIPLGNPDRGPGGYGVAAFARKNLFVMRQFALPVPASAEQRTAVVVRTAGSDPVYLVVTHLPYEETPEMTRVRLESLACIERTVRENHYCPAILLGDLNVLPGSPEIDFLRRNWTVCNDSRHACTWPADNPNMEIDYIAFHPADAFAVKDVHVHDERIASDHRPLVVDLIPRRGRTDAPRRPHKERGKAGRSIIPPTP